MRQALKSRSSVWEVRLMLAATGLAVFLITFCLSLAATCTWTEHRWPGSGQADLAAILPAFIIAAILTVVWYVFAVIRTEKEEDESSGERPGAQ
jgi:hypothetical protein